ncbi:MAG: hypothetical protein Q4A74_04605 [Cardiobacteriaceae bacterium]|nr:hypothetical protein [Cardiobacteriaceae bacterium]
MNRIRIVLDNLLAHYGAQHWWENENRLVDWVSMILIQQTTQANAEKALALLHDILSVPALHTISESELQQRVRPAGFYKQKARYIKALIM